MARSAASHCPDRISRGTWRSGGPEATHAPPETPLGSQHWCGHVPRTTKPEPNLQLSPRAHLPPARKPGRWGRREGPRARLGRSTAPARPPVAPARAALGLGGVFVGGRVRRGAASRLSLQGRVLGPGRGPARFRALSECASGGLGGGVHRRCPFPSVDLLRLHSRAAIYLEWVILACFPRAASRSPGVEH